MQLPALTSLTFSRRILALLLSLVFLIQSSSASEATERFMLKGISKIGDLVRFSVMDRDEDHSKWLQVGQSINGFTITAFRPEEQTIEYEWNSSIGEMRLATASDSPLAVNFTASTVDSAEAPNGQETIYSVRRITRSAPSRSDEEASHNAARAKSRTVTLYEILASPLPVSLKNQIEDDAQPASQNPFTDPKISEATRQHSAGDNLDADPSFTIDLDSLEPAEEQKKERTEVPTYLLRDYENNR